MVLDLERFRKRFAPRWLIMLIDTAIVLCSLALSYALRFDFDIPEIEIELLKTSIFLFLTVRLGGLLISRTYAGVIRYTSTEDAARILRTCLISTIILLGAGLFRYFIFDKIYFLPISILLLEFFLTSFLLISFRLMVKLLYVEQNNPKKNKTKVILYGAGESGIITKRTLDRDAGTAMEVVAYIDDDRRKAGKKLEGVTIYRTEKLSNLIEERQVDQVISTMMNPELVNRQKVIDVCLKHGVKMLDVPPVTRWIKGELSFRQLRPIPVEDLLEREVIELDRSAISSNLKGKRIMITGGAGSIGAEIVRQVLKYSPSSICILDQAESPLHDISTEVDEMNTGIQKIAVLADICNREHLISVFESVKPEIVFHAAAYKHVPMIEDNVSEGIRTNIGGSKNLVDLSISYRVERFVLISTDKAVNPTNVMGATKRIAELYVRSRQSEDGPVFVITRFGNVLGSNGSVIPRFKKQIEAGGPITVTHKDIERYFMTIPEACQLVLEAEAMGNGGEIYVFDMGKSVKILDLAKKMIGMSGLEAGRDIEIEITGLRPGEKIKEEMLADKEKTLPTHNHRILIARTIEPSTNIESEIEELLIENNIDLTERVKKMKRIVPEFKSMNSKFQLLDQ
ncbi:MAG: polysaccharide biosynthesis protein [Flavobacteriales bacterium]|nr:polysaccharide biosynthesis protein [Flavobacteriales bacterium]